MDETIEPQLPSIEERLKEALFKQLHLAIYQEAARLVRIAREKNDAVVFDTEKINLLKGKLLTYMKETMQKDTKPIRARLLQWADDDKLEKSIKVILPDLIEHIFWQESAKTYFD